MATPQLGSLRVPGLLAWATPDSRVLRAHSEFVARIIQSFQSSFHCAEEAPNDDRFHVAAWAVSSAADAWVDRLSAGIGIGDSQKLVVRVSHGKVVKPTDKDDSEAYRFVCRPLEHALQPRALPFRNDNYRPVQREELADLGDLGRQLIGDGVSDVSQMLPFWQRNPEVFQIVERITRSNGRRTTEFVGFFTVIPITEATAEQLKLAQLSPSSLSPACMPEPGEPISAVYVGSVAGVDKSSRGAALHFLQAHLKSLASGLSLRVLTRPTTPDGLRFVHGHAFRPIVGTVSDLGIIHENSLTGLGRQLRAKRRRTRRNQQLRT